MAVEMKKEVLAKLDTAENEKENGMYSLIKQQLEMIQNFSIGCDIYVIHKPVSGDSSVEKCNLEQIEVIIHNNNYANISLVVEDRLGNIVDVFKLEELNKKFFLTEEAAKKALER